jgi:hypothetical protein
VALTKAKTPNALVSDLTHLKSSIAATHLGDIVSGQPKTGTGKGKENTKEGEKQVDKQAEGGPST